MLFGAPSGNIIVVKCTRGVIKSWGLRAPADVLSRIEVRFRVPSGTRTLMNCMRCYHKLRFRVASYTRKLLICMRCALKSWGFQLHPETRKLETCITGILKNWCLKFYPTPIHLWIVCEVLSEAEVRALSDTCELVSCMRGVIRCWALEFHPRRVSELHEKHCRKLRFRVPSDTCKLVNCI